MNTIIQTKPITRYTRASQNGKNIMCPCGAIHRVYHFAWSALQCQSCNQCIQKTDYREVIE